MLESPAFRRGEYVKSSELLELWYSTIYNGVYSSKAKYPDVRNVVLKSAVALNFSVDKIRAIERAFDEVGIMHNNVNFSGKIIDSTTDVPLSGVKVTVYKEKEKESEETTPSVVMTASSTGYVSRLIQKVKTFLTEQFSMKLDKGEYSVTFTKSGYKPYTTEVSIGTADVELNVALDPDVVEVPEIPEGTEIPIDETHFPDPTFRGYVSLFDRNSDGVLSESEISSVTEISLYNDSGMAGNNVYTYQKGVLYSLQGVEYFTALKTLHCIYNSLTALDVSKNAALETLYCYGNQLTELDVSKNAALKKLWCNENKLTKLNVSGLSQLEELMCYKNQLTVLDLSDCTNLVTLQCYENQLIALDVSSCRALTNLSCSNNQLTTLNVNNCAALRILLCSDNKLTTLNLSGCPSLTMLTCGKNQLTALDLSNCPQLKSYSSVSCDSGVTITWPSTTTSTTASRTTNVSSSNVLAILPTFTPSKSGTYTFKASLDREKPEGSTLILLSNSEDIKGSFSESGMNIEVSADLVEGRTYNPVIIAQEDREEQGGGCNVGVLGTLVMMLSLGFVLKKQRPQPPLLQISVKERLNRPKRNLLHVIIEITMRSPLNNQQLLIVALEPFRRER